jgi:hypothetical protein
MRLARHLMVLALGFAAIVAACDGAATPSTPAGGESSAPAASTPIATATAEASATEVPTGTPTEPTSTPTLEPASPSADVESPVPGSADACTGTDKNREFYMSVATDVAWTLYCPVLPAGWFVETGEYRGASGGWMEISYKGPSGARLELHEGSFCSDADGCVPSGPDAGMAAFGDMDGTLVAVDDGGWAVVVDRGDPISWLLVVTGVDEEGARTIADDLIAVDG